MAKVCKTLGKGQTYKVYKIIRWPEYILQLSKHERACAMWNQEKAEFTANAEKGGIAPFRYSLRASLSIFSSLSSFLLLLSSH